MAMLTLHQSSPIHSLDVIEFVDDAAPGEFRKPETFTEVVAGLTALFSARPININLVKAYLASYDVKKEDWQDFVTFDKKKYTRNLIWEGNGKFNIMLTCWDVNQSSSIHDHSTSHCFMKILDGDLSESLYEINQESWMLEAKSNYKLETNTVAYTHDSFGLHRISNDSPNRRAVSLHIYSPPFRCCHQVDEVSGVQTTCQMEYNAVFKEQISRLDPALSMPASTTIISSNPQQQCVFSEGHVSDYPAPQTMDDVVAGLMSFFSSTEVNTSQVRAFMESYAAPRDQWRDYAIFDKYKYTRNLIHEGNGKFNLILVCWNKNQKSTIHDHADSHCFMKVMDGSLTETLYDWPEPDSCPSYNGAGDTQEDAAMKPVRSVQLQRGSVAYINDLIGLHRVGNESSSEGAVSLHVYSPPFDMCQVFNERNGGKMTCNVTYHSKFGHKINRKLT